MFDWLSGIVGDASGWVKDVAASVFTEETAMSALTGAVIGGATAAITGEDIIDGALMGGGIGGIVGTYNSYQDNQATSPVSDVDVNKLAPMETTDASPVDINENIGTESLFGQPAADIAINGLTSDNVASAQSKYNFTYKPLETKPTGLLGSVKSGWDSLGSDMKKDIVSGALKGGASYLVSQSQAKSQEKQLKLLEEMRRESDKINYDRTKSKVGGASGLIPTFSINKTEYDSNRLNPAR